MQSELLSIVTKTTQHLLSVGSLATATTSNQHPLLNLLELIFKQFKLIADSHQIALKNYLSVMQRYSINGKLYEIMDLWSQAQAVVCLKRKKVGMGLSLCYINIFSSFNWC